MGHLHTETWETMVAWLSGPGNLRVREADPVGPRASLAAPEFAFALLLVCPGPKLME